MANPGRFEAVIGLEVHAQLLTRSKLFCACSTEFGAPPNTHVCPVCLGLPGALPVLNRRAIDMAIRAAVALGCEVRGESRFARKSYFYPDLAKGYQISQYELPLNEHGHLDIAVSEPAGHAKRIRIRRIHVEEDAGKNIHGASGDRTLVDFNRAGVPLVEIVGEPDLESAEEAEEYLVRLREVLMFIGVNDGNLEEGSFRCDANVSIRPVGSKELGTRCELKNINSFRFVRKALEWEIRRQKSVVSSGGTIEQQTLGWSESAGEALPLRSKEEAHDYRYFPDPDLPPLRVDDAWIATARRACPELPRARRERWVSELSLTAYDAEVLGSHPAIAAYFERCVELGAPRGIGAKRLANFVQTELKPAMQTHSGLVLEVPVSERQLVDLLALVDGGTLSGRLGKEVLATMIATSRDAGAIVREKGLEQQSDVGALRAIVQGVVAARPEQAEKLRAGKTALRGFFVGAVMKETQGKANPAVVQRLLDEIFGGAA